MSDHESIFLRPPLDVGGLRPSFTRVGNEVIIRQGDQLGIFTPITGSGDLVTGEVNLEKLVQVLRDEVTALQSENQELRGKLAEAEAVHEPDDFASALGQSLDVLQHRLADSTNGTSAFAVRELQFEANVHVAVSKLGALEYRFPQPGLSVAPESLSRLKLSVVPIARAQEALEEPPPPSPFTPDVGIDEIHGIGEAYRRRLNKAGIFTVKDFVSAGSRARTVAEMEAMLAVDRRRLGEWLEHAELVLLKGIDGAAASVLHEAKVHNLQELSEAEPSDVAERFNAVAANRGRYRRRLDDEGAAALVEAARLYGSHKADTSGPRR